MAYHRPAKERRPRGAAAGPLRDVVEIDETGFYVRMTLRCGHIALQYPYRMKQHRPYPRRKRCDHCQGQQAARARQAQMKPEGGQ